ncbi:hypothetical protein B296_00030313 [Ensete ventricosum]|uniref:Secreted protein n=1 Tax=Ensete ventricosum TaxID=4639 RepID=A0A426XYI3_ENSVE|nr:hypothetical protein B296_00030313 [Ensete ventricosum]
MCHPDATPLMVKLPMNCLVLLVFFLCKKDPPGVVVWVPFILHGRQKSYRKVNARRRYASYAGQWLNPDLSILSHHGTSSLYRVSVVDAILP